MSLLPASKLVLKDRTGQTLERCEDGDLFHDYVLGQYTPLAPHTNKLRSVNLLYRSFAECGVSSEGTHLVHHVRNALGPFRTVWGIKTLAGKITGWEFYFYDFARTHADLSISRMCGVLAPLLTVDCAVSRELPWHMWSVEFSPQHLQKKATSAVDIYIDMRSYKAHGSTLAFENVYTFHDSRKDIDAVLHRLRSSVHFDDARDNLGALIPPWLFRCGRMCVANKRRADGLYFSRIATPAAQRFVAERAFPESVVRFFAEHRGELDHLLWDVGFDFVGDTEPLVITKASIYGSF
ncbi:MAG: hypothetical protein IPK82_18480 [Polyangiaceae bacterium]|nr:hypothetical protein [Polyangiaceae bacterium]